MLALPVQPLETLRDCLEKRKETNASVPHAQPGHNGDVCALLREGSLNKKVFPPPFPILDSRSPSVLNPHPPDQIMHSLHPTLEIFQ
jgi:hypothetical protein